MVYTASALSNIQSQTFVDFRAVMMAKPMVLIRITSSWYAPDVTSLYVLHGLLILFHFIQVSNEVLIPVL